MKKDNVKGYKWFLFDQNNSGGSFDVNKNVCHRLFIQAKNADEAHAIAESKGVYFNGVDDGMDCECCGDRWYPTTEEISFPLEYNKREGEIFATVEAYAQYLADNYGWTKPDCYIYYKDGSKKEIKTHCYGYYKL